MKDGNTSDVAQLALTPNNEDSVCKTGKPSVCRQQSPLSLHLPTSSPRLLLYLLIGVLPSPLSPSPRSHISAAFAVCIQHSHFPYLPYMPLLPLLIHNTLPQLCFPCAPTRLAIIAEENSLDLKISMSVSVLLPWRVPQGCAALWMALSVRLVWGSIHTHRRTTHTHTLSKGHSKAVITSIPRLCYYCYPPSSQRGLGPFLWVHSSKTEAQKPSSNKVPSPIT